MLRHLETMLIPLTGPADEALDVPSSLVKGFRTAPVRLTVLQQFHQPKTKITATAEQSLSPSPPAAAAVPGPSAGYGMLPPASPPAASPLLSQSWRVRRGEEEEEEGSAKNTALCWGSVRGAAGRGRAGSAPQCAAARSGPRRRDARPAPGLRGLRLAAAG